MTVESASYLSGLNAGLPGGSDQKLEGDNHLRLLKTVLQNTFPFYSQPTNLVVGKGVPYQVVPADNNSIIIATAGVPINFNLPVSSGLPNGWNVSFATYASRLDVYNMDSGAVLIGQFGPDQMITYYTNSAGWFLKTSAFGTQAATKNDIVNLLANLYAPSGTNMFFLQNSPPAGWNLNGSFHDRVLRIIGGGAVTAGGSWQITGLFDGLHTLTMAELPSVVIQYTRANYGGGFGGGAFPSMTGNITDQFLFPGGGQGHNHGVAQDGSWRPAYVDCVLGTKV